MCIYALINLAVLPPESLTGIFTSKGNACALGVKGMQKNYTLEYVRID